MLHSDALACLRTLRGQGVRTPLAKMSLLLRRLQPAARALRPRRGDEGDADALGAVVSGRASGCADCV